MLNNVTEVTRETLAQHAMFMLHNGYRFVTSTCVDLGEAFDVIYHFDKDYILQNLRLKLVKGEVLPSISNIYKAALVVENEMKDLFGFQVSGLILDFEGKFILSEEAPKSPLCNQSIVVVKNTKNAEATPSANESK